MIILEMLYSRFLFTIPKIFLHKKVQLMIIVFKTLLAYPHAFTLIVNSNTK